MGPRKKSKSATELKDGPQTKPDASGNAQPPSEASSVAELGTPQAAQVTHSPAPVSSDVPADGRATEAQVDNRASWYGSWRQKATPVAEVVRESIAANGKLKQSSPAPSISRPSRDPTTPSPKRYLSGSLIKSAKSTPLAATMTRLDISSENKSEIAPASNLGSGQSNTPELKHPEPPLPPEPSLGKDVDRDQNKDVPKETNKSMGAGGWFGWWSRPDGYEEGKQEVQEDALIEEAKNKPLPGTTPLESPAQSKLLPPAETDGASDVADKGKPSTKKDAPGDTRSWFGLWSLAQNTRPDPAPSEQTAKVDQPETNQQTSNKIPHITTENITFIAPGAGSIRDSKDASRKPSGWAFWSRDGPESPAATTDSNVLKQVGELAVANTPSQSHPEAAQFNEQDEPSKKEAPKPAPKPKRTRPLSRKSSKAELSTTPVKSTPSHSPARKTADSTSLISESERNLVLPSFEKTYSLVQQASVWQQIRQYLIGTEPDAPHLHIATNPPRIKKALAIGIHGFFPSPILQKLLGPPTGTSIRFSNSAASAIKSWTERHGYECEIEKVALEGEGFITDRIDTLWKLLLNWIEPIRSADFIMVACHSQGVPVAIMLVAKLIQFGCVSSARIGICAMAGVNLGPFAEYKTRIFGGSALELFDFSNPTSNVSKMYQSALEGVLKYGVKVVYVGSIDDQLVSLEVRSKTHFELFIKG
jgi:hypothetical protein